MQQLAINYLDEKTGGGRYKIVVNPYDKAYANTIGDNFEFELWINIATPPIQISIPEGGSTTSNIVITFNVDNLYRAVGDCYLKIGRDVFYYTSETIAEHKENESISIVANGTYFVQLYTTSGQLLYSYKVTKAEPLNGFAIIAIIIGVAVVGTIVTITILLRKRQRVK